MSKSNISGVGRVNVFIPRVGVLEVQSHEEGTCLLSCRKTKETSLDRED